MFACPVQRVKGGRQDLVCVSLRLLRFHVWTSCLLQLVDSA